MNVDNIGAANLLCDILEELEGKEDSISKRQGVGQIPIVTDRDSFDHSSPTVGTGIQPLRSAAVGREHVDRVPALNQPFRHFIGAAGLSAVGPRIVKVWNDEDDTHSIRTTFDPTEKSVRNTLPIVVLLYNSKRIPAKLVQTRPV
jgi:hypothetical protein